MSRNELADTGTICWVGGETIRKWNCSAQWRLLRASRWSPKLKLLIAFVPPHTFGNGS